MNCPYMNTVDLNGITRSNTITGGVGYHYPVLFGSNQNVDGLHPRLNDPVQEGHLYQMREWGFDAYQGACIFGFTEFDASTGSYFTGATCLENTLRGSTAPASIRKNIDVGSSDKAYSGDAILQFTEAASGSRDYVSSATYSDQFATPLAQGTGHLNGHSVGPVIARMAVYLHVLLDRISHYQCIDDTPVAAPAGNTVTVDRALATSCGDTNHAWGHFIEVGQSSMAATSLSAIDYAYSELALFAQRHPEYVIQGALSLPEVESALTDVLTTSAPGARLARMVAMNEAYGFGQMPGMGPRYVFGDCPPL